MKVYIVIAICLGGLLVSGNVVKRSEDYDYYVKSTSGWVPIEGDSFVKTTKIGVDILLPKYKENFDVKSNFINTLILAQEHNGASIGEHWMTVENNCTFTPLKTPSEKFVNKFEEGQMTCHDDVSGNDVTIRYKQCTREGGDYCVAMGELLAVGFEKVALPQEGKYLIVPNCCTCYKD